MSGRLKKLSPRDEAKIVAMLGAGMSVAAVAAANGVTRPTIYRAVRRHDGKEAAARVGTAPVSFTVSRTHLNAFDATLSRLGLKSRASALRRICRIPAGFLEPDPDLADALQEVARQLSAIGRNVNQLVATKNYEVRRGAKLKLTRAQEQLLHDLLKTLEHVSTDVRTMEGKRASHLARRFIDGVVGCDHGTL